MYRHFFKRLFDIVLSILAIVVLIPFWTFLALMIFIDDPGPIFFKQKRIGRDSKYGDKQYFNIIKYRSMKNSTPSDVPTHLLEKPDQYITKMGSILRITSLDELPQVFNIFVGHMSIVGPRPALWNQDDLYEERAKYGVNAVTPGLTGWAQIKGRDELEIQAKAKLDGEYVERLSLAFDWKCLWGTVKNVLRREGVVEGGTGMLNKKKPPSEDEMQNSCIEELSKR